MAMGLLSFPLTTIIIFYWATEAINGDRNNSLNPFFWDVVIQNSPSTTYYDPTIPRLYRWDLVQEVIRAACKTYVEDLIYIESTQ